MVSVETCDYWGNQLAKRGMIVPADDPGLSGAFVWRQSNTVNAPEGSFSGDLKAIAEAFRKFLSSEGDLLTATYSDAEIYELLRKGAIGSLFPRLYETDGNYKSDDQYVFSRFVESVRTAAPLILDAIVKLRRAAIVCDLILHMQAPKQPPKNAQPITVYIDAPLVMDIIGLSGKQRQDFSRRLLDGFKQLNFTPMINRDMIFEIGNNIKALLKTEPGRRFGPTADAIRHKELSPTYVEAALERVEPMVQDAGITIDRNFPSHTSHSAITDELEQALFSKLQSHYNSLDAASRDAKTVRGVFGRRGDARPMDMYSSRAFFLTGNEMVATVSNRFFRDQIGYTERNFPVVISRSTAAALTDAIVGVASAGNMTLQDLLINAADATQYDPDVMIRIEDKLRSMTPNEASDLAVLLSSTDYSQLAMDMMRGNARNVSVQSVQQLVENVKTKLEQQAAKRVSTQRTRERRHAMEQNAALNREVGARTAALDVAIEALEASHQSAVGASRKWHQQAAGRVRMAKRATFLGGILAACLVGLAAYIAIEYAKWLEDNPILRLVIAALIGFVTAIPLVGLPSLREAVIGAAERRAWSALAARLSEFDYSLPVKPIWDEDLVVKILDRQFSEKVAAIRDRAVTSLEDLG